MDNCLQSRFNNCDANVMKLMWGVEKNLEVMRAANKARRFRYSYTGIKNLLNSIMEDHFLTDIKL